MSVVTQRKLLIAAATLLLCGVLLAVRGRWQDSASRAAPAARAPEAPRVEPAAIASTVLDRAAVEQLLPNLKASTWVHWDPLAVVRVVPDRSDTIPWPEHPEGQVTLTTNNLGFREDQPTREGPPPAGLLRVLVLGDSHTFGLVNNRESLANVLERRLAPALKPRRCEVLNAAVSSTGPYEQRALLGVLLDLQPQVVVCVLYTGNDFINAQAYADFETRRARVPLPRDAQQRLKLAQETERARMAQNTSQVHSFLHRAGDAEVALAATIDCYREMAEYCVERGARFLVAVLPPKEDVDLLDLGHMEAIRDRLQLCADDYAVDRRLAARFADALAAVGVVVVDLLPALAAFPQRPMYWTSDHHLAVTGHAVVAGALEAPVLEALQAAATQR